MKGTIRRYPVSAPERGRGTLLRLLGTPAHRGPALLDPTFLIASTINEDGWIELPAVQGGFPVLFARALFGLDEDGAFVQQVAPGAAGHRGDTRSPEALDMTFFARCLCGKFGSLTPDLFTVRGYEKTGGLGGQLARTDAASEEARRETLRSAFLVYRSAYGERLV